MCDDDHGLYLFPGTQLGYAIPLSVSAKLRSQTKIVKRCFVGIFFSLIPNLL